jgi:hypothetical protein
VVAIGSEDDSTAIYVRVSARFIMSTFARNNTSKFIIMPILSCCLPEIFSCMSCVFSEIVMSLCLKGYITNNSVSVEGLFVEAVKLSRSVFNDYSPSVA